MGGVSSTNQKQNESELKTVIDISHLNHLDKSDQLNKSYVIHNSHTYILFIKMLDEKVFIYVDYELVYVSTYSRAEYFKCIQVSNDFKYLSIPENDKINIYSIDFLHKGSLHYVSSIEITSLPDHILINNSLYKCVLTDRVFSIITRHKIIIINYNDHTINIINNSIEILKFSPNGKYLLYQNRLDNDLTLLNLLNNESITVKNNTTKLNLSDDGKIFYCSNNSLKIYDPETNIDSNVDIDVDFTITAYLMNYDHYLDAINEINETDYSKMYALIGINKTSIFCRIIKYSDIKGYYSDQCKSCTIKIDTDLVYDYVYHNGTLFIYKTNTKIIVYDFSKSFPLKIIDQLRSEIQFKMNREIKSDTLTIVGANDSKHTYKISKYMSNIIDPEFGTILNSSLNANIDIWDSNKSFYIYQDLLEGKINQSDIINNISMKNIKNKQNNHSMMCELLDHMYEYTRVILLNNNVSVSNRSKAMYVGYVLLDLVLKYCFKHNCMDCIDTFCDNFPSFKKFVDIFVDSIEA